MAKFKTLNSNFKISIKVENGSINFFLDGKSIIKGKDIILTIEKSLIAGNHQYQWQVNGKKDITEYSIRIFTNGASLPSSSIGPKKLKSGNIDFNVGGFTI